MSESQEPAPTAASGGSRYQRTSGGLVGAMLVTVLAVFAFAAFRAVTRDNEPTPVRTVDYAATVKVARADKQLLVLAPERLPVGWKATSATYERGASPSWHLGILTEKGKYVGVEESRSSVQDLVDEHVDADAQRGADIKIAGVTWQSWTDAGGDYAVARALQLGGRTVESWLVVGTAPEAEIDEFAGTLKGGTPRVAG
jgi:hypothetical protein